MPSERKVDKTTPKIKEYIAKTPDINPTKRSSSQLSPNENDPDTKKVNKMPKDDQPTSSTTSGKSELQTIYEALSQELKTLREVMDQKYSKVEDSMESKYDRLERVMTAHRKDVSHEIQKLEHTLTVQNTDLSKKVQSQMENQSEEINKLKEENRSLKKENNYLTERINKIESTQLSNNIIVTGISEQPVEKYEMTKQRIHEIIATALSNSNSKSIEENTPEANDIIISYCNRVGVFKLNQARPISVSFQKGEDKEFVLTLKRHMPSGIYVDNEYLPHIKRSRDRLRPILQLAKKNPNYRDKSKLENDKLVINGIRYTLNDLHKLPEDLSAYKAAERQNEEYLAFHGEFSPLSNFHPSPFKIGNQRFHCTEQYIQYEKAMHFGDNLTANQIIQCMDAFEAKRLGYRVTGFDMQQWKEHGYDLCIEGIRAKFHQNHNLMMLLKSTGTKIIVEATRDQLWGTGIPLCDQRVLDPESWYNTGWMSTMLATIRGEMLR